MKLSKFNHLDAQVQEEDYLGGGQTLASGFRVAIQVTINYQAIQRQQIQRQVASKSRFILHP